MADYAKHDRGALAAPVRATIYSGRVARTHTPNDPLVYRDGNEYRRLDEVQRIVDLLPGTPVIVNHPPKNPDGSGGMIAEGSKPKIVGKVIGARMDDDSAVADIAITHPDGETAIKNGIKELSLGYYAGLDPDRYQINTRIDHLALVPMGRCGGACRVRTDDVCTCGSSDLEPGAQPSSETMGWGDAPHACKNHAITYTVGVGTTSADAKQDKTLTAEDRHKIHSASFAVPSREALPIEDEGHVKAAMARFNQTHFLSTAEKKTAYHKVLAKAHELGIDSSGFEKSVGKHLDDDTKGVGVDDDEPGYAEAGKIPRATAADGPGFPKGDGAAGYGASRPSVDSTLGGPKAERADTTVRGGPDMTPSDPEKQDGKMPPAFLAEIAKKKAAAKAKKDAHAAHAAGCDCKFDDDDDGDGDDNADRKDDVEGESMSSSHPSMDGRRRGRHGRNDHKDHYTMEELKNQLAAAIADAAQQRARADAADADLKSAKTALTTAEIKATNAEAAIGAERARADAADAAAKAVTEKARTDAAGEFDAAVAARVDVLTAADRVLGAVDKDGKKIDRRALSSKQLKIDMIKHVDSIDVDLKKEDAFVDGVFLGSLERHARGTAGQASALKAVVAARTDNAQTVAVGGVVAERAARDQMLAAQRDAWKRGAGPVVGVEDNTLATGRK